MSFDTLYRPRRFADVIGQQATIAMLKRLLQRGEACQSSYIFAGLSGAGKTTLARIFARAILCPNLTEDQEPCNECESCKAILEQNATDSFVELDAANNSGADTVRSIIESLAYTTFGGQSRRIYLFDEAHRLSTQAQDALLKPMEDSVAGTKDRRMVCFLCTTELEKIRTAIRSRSHTFKIQEPTLQEILVRLEYICADQGIAFEREALSLIIEQGKGHIRDMVRSLERVSQVCGSIDLKGTREVLGLDVVPLYFRILGDVGQSKDNPEALKGAFGKAREATETVSASKVVQGLLWACMEAYKHKAYQFPSSYSVEITDMLNRLGDDDTKVLKMARRLETVNQQIFSAMDSDYALLYVLSLLGEELTPAPVLVRYAASADNTIPTVSTPQTPLMNQVKKDEKGLVESKSGKFKQQPTLVDESQMPYVSDKMKPTKPEDLSGYGPITPKGSSPLASIPLVTAFTEKNK